MLDSVIEAKKKYYPQTRLEECKCEQERINDDLEKTESDESDSETESDNNNDESNK